MIVGFLPTGAYHLLCQPTFTLAAILHASAFMASKLKLYHSNDQVLSGTSCAALPLSRLHGRIESAAGSASTASNLPN